MKRMRTKLTEDLDQSLRALSAIKGVKVQDYCEQVLDLFVHGAIATAQHVKSNHGVVDMGMSSGKCDHDMDLWLCDDEAFNTHDGVLAIAMVNGISPSEAVRHILSVHAFGSSHALSLRLPAIPGKGRGRGVG